MAKRKTPRLEHDAEMNVITVWPNGQTFAEDGVPQYDILKIDDNAEVTFRNGINFKARCNRLIMGKNVKIVGVGTDGANGQTPPGLPPVQCSGTPAQHQFIIHPAFLRYAKGVDGSDPRYPYRTIGYSASQPGRGGRGAVVSISYHHYEGHKFDKLKQANMKGGQGGKGAAGGNGAAVLCTINPCGGGLRGPAGAPSWDASDGAPGDFNLIEYKPGRRKLGKKLRAKK